MSRPRGVCIKKWPTYRGLSDAFWISWKRRIPVAIIAAGVAGFFMLGFTSPVPFEKRRQHGGELMSFVAARPIFSFPPFITTDAPASCFTLRVTGSPLCLGTAAALADATTGATMLALQEL
jgi:hypothetical protein